ncbi:WYL domain-containing protein [Virgibacillus halophilus]|uniref:WYL domain-containing protein n=1 Tax=Tigheibacillus halophilus TaxID=361280 RepID=A0ABU5CAL6_9BACI|nr:WYL domain-containing protein [Virgibacillus halophilus]
MLCNKPFGIVKKLKIHYEQQGGEQKERLVEPLGLVAKGNKWYLVALKNGELRNYRVSRIHSAKVESETFRRPLHFNLATYWEQSKAEFVQNLPKYDVQVEIHTKIIKRINFTDKFVKVIKTENPNGGKWIPATLRFNDKQEAIEFILGFANKIKVVSPKYLQDKVVALAMSVIDFYNDE